MVKQNINDYSWIAYVVLSINLVAQACAAPGTIANSPLFASTNAPPNVFFELDDSGSMDWETMIKEYWDACAYDKDNAGKPGDFDCGSLIADDGLFTAWSGSRFRDYAYIFDNGDNLYDNGCDGSNFPKLEGCTATVKNFDWRVWSSDLNVLYYDPDVTYLPWQKGDGTSMPNASFTAARSNPKSGETGYSIPKDLTGFIFNVWTDSHGFSGTRPRRGSNINRTAGSDGFVDLWDNHTRYKVNTNDVAVDSITYAPTGTGALNPSAAASTITTGLNGRTLAQEQQNIANWYQYYRRRAFVAKGAIAKVISDNPDYRFGLNVINSPTFFTEVPTGLSNFSGHNVTLLDDLFSLNWQALGTPLRSGLQRAGNYFDNTDGRPDPIVLECEQNFTSLITDGFWNDPDALNPAVGNADGDGYSSTLADVAQYYYAKDLSPLANNVPAGSFDTATYQHMVTFAIAFGLNGLLTDTDNDGWPGNSPGLAKNGLWGNPFNSSPEKIDDLWHSAFNSKGTFISASTPQVLANAIDNAVANINDRAGSAASVSFNTSTLTSGSNVYLAQFIHKGNFWSGDLTAFALNTTTGNVSSTPQWTVAGNPVGAAGVLEARAAPVTSRTIITHDGSVGVPFQWANLTEPQKNDLRTEPNGTVGVDVKAQARVNYIRGDKANEEGKGGTYTFKGRSKLLGDIINSDPQFVGKPNSAWPNTAPFPTAAGQTYSEFSAANISRAEMLYVGANDGMLHGFKASDGSEAIAYIPGTLYSSSEATAGLHYLTDPAYTHRFYVDMPSVVEDAYFNTGSGVQSWHSVLIGGERAGGKGIFALDVTNPALFSEANAAQIALWEFDNSDDADMGFSFSKPSIAMMANGRWAAILGNGYNNNGDGKAKLFILFLDGGLDDVWTPGTDYIELSTNTGAIVSGDCANASSDCNGLSTPQTADVNSDQIVDRVYAGDLKGNMWAFDLSDPVASNWKVAYSGNPLFIAGKPITSKPSLISNPAQPNGAAPNLLVFFGTGQYLGLSDVSTTDVQTFYGVWDHGVSSLTSLSLVEQTFETGTFTNADIADTSKFSVLTNNPVDYVSKSGWFISLTQNTGERIIVDSDVFGTLLFFNTWIPNNAPCGSSGSGVLMTVRPDTGGRPSSAAFSLTGTNPITNKDLLTKNGVNYTVSGEKFSKGLPSSSGFLPGYQYTAGSDTTTVHKRKIAETPLSPSNMKRISWQELR